MSFHNLIEREISAGEPWETKQSESYGFEDRDVWEIEISKGAMRNSSEIVFHHLHWSQRSLSKLRYLHHFVR